MTAWTNALAPWLEFYNNQRRQAALAGNPDQPAVTNLMTEYIWTPADHLTVGQRTAADVR